jgi:hypothetical protein
MLMRRISFFIALLCCAPVFAQQKPSSPEAERRQWLDRYLRENSLDLPNGQSRAAEETQRRREARIRQWQFFSLTQRFLLQWNDLAAEYNARGAVNPKKFKAVSKAFRDLEKSDGWLSPK